jgi:hypothetical protein
VWKDGVPLALTEVEQGVAVVLEEAHQAAEGLDPLPLVLGGDPGVQSTPGFARSRPIGVGLLQDSMRAEHRDAAGFTIGSGGLLELLHAGDDECPEGLD